jgi:iron complex outermembrane receptor protein
MLNRKKVCTQRNRFRSVDPVRKCLYSIFTGLMELYILIFPLMTSAKDSTYTGIVSIQDSSNSKDSGLYELEPILVTALRPGDASNGYRYQNANLGPLGEIPLKDIPFTVNVTSGDLVANHGAHILADALKANPAVSVSQQPSTDGRGGSEVTIRGFDPFYLQNGLLMRNALPIPVEHIERIEVTDGLSGFLYPFGSPGGVMNFITKQPSSAPELGLSTGIHNGAVKFIYGDIAGPVSDGKRLLYRTDAFLEDGNGFISGSSQKNSRLSGSVRWNPLNGTALTAVVSHQEMKLQGQQAAFIVDPSKGVEVPFADDFDPSALYGQQWTFVKGRQDMFGAFLESKLNSVFAFRGAYNYTSLWRKNRGLSATLIDNNGNYRATYSDGAPQNTFENSAYALFDAKFKTGEVNHSVTGGLNHNSYIQKNNFVSLKNIPVKYMRSSGLFTDTFNIYHPEYALMPDTVAPSAQNQRQQPIYNSFMVSDFFSYRFISILAGVNYCLYNFKNENIDTGLIKQFRQSKLTPGFGLSVKPFSFISLYASYMQGIAAGGYSTDPKAKNYLEVLSPAVSEQYETGIKLTLWDRLDINAAGFNINKINEYLDPSDNIYKQDGREIHQGFEISGTGKITTWLTFGGGGTLLDAHIEKAADKSIETKTPVNIPAKQARAFIELKMPAVSGLTLTGGINYCGIRWIDARNTAWIPENYLYDTGIRYSTKIGTNALTLNMNIVNLLNTNFWAAYKPAGTIGLCLGAPRTVSLSAKWQI